MSERVQSQTGTEHGPVWTSEQLEQFPDIELGNCDGCGGKTMLIVYEGDERFEQDGYECYFCGAAQEGSE